MAIKKYLSGQYKAASEERTSIKSVAYKIGGLVFTGQHQEARVLFDSFEAKLPQGDQVVARFHIGISYTRTSDYQRAKELFLENISTVEKYSLRGVPGFYAWQGMSFLHFFFSKHSKSQEFAEKGYSHLLLMEEPPPLLIGLSLDIQGHNKIQMGQVHQGLQLLGEALKVTKANRLKELFSEIEISKLIYESDFDTKIKKQINNLKNYLKRTDNKNDYSCSELVLQISKLHFLRGDFAQANNFLNQHFDYVYKNQNKRKVAILNTLISQLMIHKGQYLEALSIINVAQNYLNEEMDKSLYLPLLGLNVKIFDLIGQESLELAKKSREIASGIERTINRKIQDRFSNDIQSREVGEDQLGDLFDKAYSKNPEALKVILKNEILILLLPYFGLTPGKKYIVASETEATCFTIDHDGIENRGKHLSKLQLKILHLLKSGPATKQTIIEDIWGYEYDIIRHDPLIYTTLGRLRKILGDKGKWIYTDEQYYYLAPEVELILPEFSLPEPELDKGIRKIPFPDLNHRQMQYISDGDPTPISVSSYGEKWDVTRMTALRDLKELTEKKLVQKIGRGKATRYILI